VCAGQERGHSVHLEERRLPVAATRGLSGRRAAVVTKLEQRPLLRVALGLDLSRRRRRISFPDVPHGVTPRGERRREVGEDNAADLTNWGFIVSREIALSHLVRV
jgi:hypothetical protein